ncbi:hypothetical protein [Shewanella subflava]|uniref:Uncharacterized protein n=1 Tax=Shewanella subflava TaxID=2986476 RepID=A0ABT3ICG0_9GAMM|nr:hypothetical protein [Shewanella subflava]MCW3173748.1 hypothetical protein [Shewanella subflava]
MIFRTTLKPNEPNVLNKQGLYFYLLTAQDSLSVRFRDADKYKTDFESEMREGMSADFKASINEITLTSKTAQYVEFWLGETKLDYSVSKDIDVGSKAVESDSRQVFFGEAVKIADYKFARKGVLIYSESDLLIGSGSLNITNGVRVKALNTMGVNTQGEIYAMATNPAYKKKVSTVVDGESNIVEQADLGQRIDVLSYDSESDSLIFADGSGCYYSPMSGFSVTPRVNVSGALGFDLADYIIPLESEDGLTYPVIKGGFHQLQTLNKKTKQVSFVSTGVTSSNSGIIGAVVDNQSMFLVLDNGDLVKASAGGFSVVNCGLTGIVAVAVEGQTVVVASSDSYVMSIDGGQTWSGVGALPRPAQQSGSLIRVIGGAVYVCDKTAVSRTLDGLNWETLVDGLSGITFFDYYLSQLVVLDGFGLGIIESDSGFVRTKYTGGVTGYSAGTKFKSIITGHLLVANQTGQVTKIEGESVVSGGVNVAVMSEIN